MKTFVFDDGAKYAAEDLIDGVLINPELPEDFHNTPNDERSELENKLWWDVSFIVVDEFQPPDNSYAEYTERLGSQSESEDEFNARIAKTKKNWDDSFPDGKRYTVYCLDGGAWDRPTWWGGFPGLDQAIECAKKGPVFMNV